VRGGPLALYNWLLQGLARFAEAQTRLLQSDDLRHHLTAILAFAVGLTGIVALTRGAFVGVAFAPVVDYLHELLVVVVVVAAVAAVVRAHSRVSAITSLGVVGFGIALVFVLFGAPDLAITQFLVETLVVIIIALVLARLPSGALRSPDNGGVRRVAGVVALLGGALFAGLLLAVTSYPLDRTLTEFFEAASYPAANGRNIVNVILVDFRGIDTLGEITVLAVGASGIFALLRRTRTKRRPEAPAPAGDDPGGPR
jgi:multicomponent Na+:H+ antiporter subunit A